MAHRGLKSSRLREALRRTICDSIRTLFVCSLGIMLFVHLAVGSNDSSSNQSRKRNPYEPSASGRTGGETNNQPQQVRIETQLVSFTVTITDSRGRFVSGLTKNSFQVYDNGVKQEIAHFSDEDVPASIGILFDVSRSMKDRMKQSISALKRFMDVSHKDDDLFLITFNDRATLSRDFTTSGNQIIESLEAILPKGSTALYDAVYLGVEKVELGRHPKKALLIISDGEDNHSRYNGRELRQRILESDVQVYAIGLTDAFSEDSDSSKYGRSLLESITDQTGGRAFFPNAYNEQQIIEICARIALELRRQYSIGFYPTDKADDTPHKIEVKLNKAKGLGGVSIRHRAGYQSVKI